MTIRQWKPVILADEKQKKWTLLPAPVYCPERVSRLQQREEGETQEDTSSLCRGDGGEKPGKPKQLQHIKEDPRDLQFPPWTKYQSIHTYAVAIQGQEPSERSKGNGTQHSNNGNSIYFLPLGRLEKYQCNSYPLLINIVLGILASIVRQEK